jgi:hypothetical protein
MSHPSCGQHSHLTWENAMACILLREERLQAEIEWLRARPQEDCDSKCEYGKRGDPAGCYCGRAAWIAAMPDHLKGAR